MILTTQMPRLSIRWYRNGYYWWCHLPGKGIMPHRYDGNFMTYKDAWWSAERHYLARHARLKPQQWLNMLDGVSIIDADGWRDKKWDEPIARREFTYRLGSSTVDYPDNFLTFTALFDEYLLKVYA